MNTDVERLAAGYRDTVQPRMVALPVYNPALRVEAVGFHRHNGRPCGILITPWFMNLVLLPGQQDAWGRLAQGTSFRVSFPAGEYRFLLSTGAGTDPHLSLPLFTTVTGFPDHTTACLVAREVLQDLYLKVTARPAGSIDPGQHSGLQRPLSRRALFRMVTSTR